MVTGRRHSKSIESVVCVNLTCSSNNLGWAEIHSPWPLISASHLNKYRPISFLLSTPMNFLTDTLKLGWLYKRFCKGKSGTTARSLVMWFSSANTSSSLAQVLTTRTRFSINVQTFYFSWYSVVVELFRSILFFKRSIIFLFWITRSCSLSTGIRAYQNHAFFGGTVAYSSWSTTSSRLI